MGPLVASMRPPLNAGENPTNARGWGYRYRASMRPPLNAGENSVSVVCEMRW